MLVANEQPQIRRLFRMPCTTKAELRAGGLSLPATAVDISERGMALTIPRPLFADPRSVTVHLEDDSGNDVELKGQIVRQEPTAIGGVLAAIHWQELDDKTLQALLVTTVGEASEWNRPGLQPASTTTRSLGALMGAIFRPWTPLLAKRRQIPRVRVEIPCTVNIGEQAVQGRTVNLSYNGLSAAFPVQPKIAGAGTVVTVEGITLHVVPIETSPYRNQVLVRFQIKHDEGVHHHWPHVLTSHWFGPAQTQTPRVTN